MSAEEDPLNQIKGDDPGPSDDVESLSGDQTQFLPEGIVLPTYQEATMEETSSDTRSNGGVRTVTIFLDQSAAKSHDFGLTLRTTPEGVVIVAVAPTSAGDRANLKAGALLLEVNGLTLVGASAEEAQVVLNECSFAPKTLMLVLDRPTTRSVSVDEAQCWGLARVIARRGATWLQPTIKQDKPGGCGCSWRRARVRVAHGGPINAAPEPALLSHSDAAAIHARHPAAAAHAAAHLPAGLGSNHTAGLGSDHTPG